MGYKRSNNHGGSGGSVFADNLTETKRLRGLLIGHGSVIDSITPIWEMVDGTDLQGKRHGGAGGKITTIMLDEGEYIVKVEGRTGSNVDRLVFHTNDGHTYACGGNGGKEFDPIKDLEVGGFFGRSGTRLDAIGFFSTDK